MQPTETLFEDAHIQVLRRAGDRRLSLVTFADLTFRPDGQDFWGREVAEKLDLDVVGFVAKRENWYPVASVEAAAPAVRAVLRRRSVGYGYSMGGYAALKHGRRLGLTASLAVAPQSSIDPRDPPHDRRYAEFHRPGLLDGMRVAGADLPPLSILLADPWEPTDGPHAAQIAGLEGFGRRVAWIRTPHAGHAAIWLLANSRLLDRAIRLAVAGRTADLARLLRERRAGSAQWHRIMGMAALRHGHVDLAGRLMGRAQALGLPPDLLDTAWLEALEGRALRLQALGRREEAVALARELGGRHRDAAPLARIGHLLAALQDWPGAEAQFRAALALDAAQPGTHLALSRMLARQGDKEGAIGAARQGVALHPAHAPLAAHLGHLLVEARQAEEAEAVLTRLLDALPGEAPAQYELSRLRFARGDRAGAERLAAAARAAAPADPDTALWHGQVLLALARPEEAAAAFRQALAAAPGMARAHRSLVRALHRAGRAAEAAAAAREGLARCPGDLALMGQLARLDPLRASASLISRLARGLGRPG